MPPPSQDVAWGPWLAELERLDHAVYEAVAATPTPRLDGAMRWLSEAADYSRLSLAASAVLAIAGGRRGRRAAASGLLALGTTSAVVNAVVKLASRRSRPDPVAAEVPPARRVPMPTSHSFPSGHTAVAVAFASGVGRVIPLAALPFDGLAVAVGYSRIHTGVHYPSDVLAGAMVGAVVADLTAGWTAGRLGRRLVRRDRPSPGSAPG
jgi:membrane-associated phospholipid phosphatase